MKHPKSASRSSVLLLLLLLLAFAAAAQPLGSPSNNIKIDQFGYLPNARKVAVVAKPITGFNTAAEGPYNPTVTANAWQVLRSTDNASVFTGTLTTWNSGAIHDQSGDQGWWFDFSALKTPGSYYLYDAANNLRSYTFSIGNNVYDDVLKAATRTFFYQRLNHPKRVAYTDAKWADSASFEGASQDRAASALDGTSPKDLHGGWADAGDYNKYTTFAAEALMPLLETYRQHPAVFGDANGIPESGNGMPDLLDEIRWEVDWLKRMQDATTTRGLYLKVGVTTWNSATPPSADNNPRYYLGECTSATISGAAVFALASIAYRSLGTASAIVYADDLLLRAQDAYARASSVTNGFTTGFELACDNQVIKAGDADITEKQQKNLVFAAAVYLYEATGNTAYKTYIDAHYTGTYPFTDFYWGPYYPATHSALLRYASLPTTEPSPGVPFATASVAAAIRNDKASQDHILSIDDYTAGTDLYRSHMPHTDYAWGSNRTKCYAGMNNFDFVAWDINSGSHAGYQEAGSAYLHYLHGVNALGKVMLSNMYSYGADNSANEMSHAWFRDGTNWDNALTSLYGPAPGYLTGGANKYYWVSNITPPYGQPDQKCYKDWNTDWNNVTSTDEASYSITEPSISNQAAYVGLLARVIAYHSSAVLPIGFLQFTVQPSAQGAQLSWRVDGTDNLQHFVVERSFDNRRFDALATVPGVAGLRQYQYTDRGVRNNERAAWYRIRAVSLNEVDLSPVRPLRAHSTLGLSVSPNPAQGRILVSGRLPEAGPVLIQVTAADGTVVRAERTLQGAGEFRRYITLDGLAAGMYWLRLQSASGEESKSFLKK
ncbi:glycoside hydrolase family 9 protein [Flaviaesturariibacter amylovorans]